MKKDRIEVKFKSDSPWKSVLNTALRQFLESWGWKVEQYTIGDTVVYIGEQK